jgi:hypothetical protein
LLLLDDGMSCGLADFGYKGRACELTATQQAALKTWVAQTLGAPWHGCPPTIATI